MGDDKRNTTLRLATAAPDALTENAAARPPGKRPVYRYPAPEGLGLTS